jgi:hypothetical protein
LLFLGLVWESFLERIFLNLFILIDVLKSFVRSVFLCWYLFDIFAFWVTLDIVDMQIIPF